MREGVVMGLSSHQRARGKTVEWLTPPEIIQALGKFDLDPCAPVKRPWPTAAKHFTKTHDGLSKKWYGRVWMNPPFEDQAVHWMRRLVAHGDGIALIAARTETRLFYECVWGRADSVLFIRSRPHFYYPNGKRAPFNSGAPICLIAYGQENDKALRKSGLGFVVKAA